MDTTLSSNSTTHEPLPQWLAPEPLPYYHPEVIKTKQQLRENQRAIEQVTFESLFDDVLDVVREGRMLVNQMFENDPRAPSYARFISWVYRDESRRARYEEAQMVGAEVIKQDMLTIADANDSLEDVNRSTLRINTRKWMLGVMDKKRFGDTKQIDQTVTINLGDAMREAQERLDRSRVVDVQARVVDGRTFEQHHDVGRERDVRIDMRLHPDLLADLELAVIADRLNEREVGRVAGW